MSLSGIKITIGCRLFTQTQSKIYSYVQLVFALSAKYLQIFTNKMYIFTNYVTTNDRTGMIVTVFICMIPWLPVNTSKWHNKCMIYADSKLCSTNIWQEKTSKKENRENFNFLSEKVLLDQLTCSSTFSSKLSDTNIYSMIALVKKKSSNNIRIN